MKRCCLLILLLAVTFGHALPAAAQQEEDRIIAGEHLSRLWDAVKLGKVTINNPELRNLILERHLSAILIPKAQPPDRRIIRRCFKVQTVFNVPDAEISSQDFSQLLAYAKDGAFERAEAIRNAVNENDSERLAVATAELQNYLEQQGGAARDSSRRFVGALLADLTLTQPELVSHVQEYRTFMKNEERNRERWANFVTPLGTRAPAQTPAPSVDMARAPAWFPRPSEVWLPRTTITGDVTASLYYETLLNVALKHRTHGAVDHSFMRPYDPFLLRPYDPSSAQTYTLYAPARLYQFRNRYDPFAVMTPTTRVSLGARFQF